MSKRTWFVMILVIVWLGTNIRDTLAQEIVLQLAVSEFDTAAYTPALLSQFEVQNSGVRVQLVSVPSSIYSAVESSSTADETLNTFANYASYGDVLAVNNAMLTPLASRAGYILDLAPLVNSDMTLNANDFFPSAWQAYQWDGGFWALPQSLDLSALIYDRQAFDTAQLAYPNESWTLNDFATAARTLTQNTGTPALTYFSPNDFAAFLRSLLGTHWYDDTAFPQTPRLATNELAVLLDTWMQLEREGVVEQLNGGILSPISIAPLGFLPDPVASLSTPMPNPQQLTASLLPSGTAAADVNAFAVSGGTAYPELAYALVKFLSQSADLAQFTGSFPAQRTLLNNTSSTEGFAVGSRLFAADMQPLIETALENALPPSELRYSTYIQQALMQMRASGADALSSLAAAETQANADLQVADPRRGSPIVVNSPNLPTNSDEIRLHFGVGTLVLPVPNSEGWQRVINEFVASDPQVSEIILHSDFTAPQNFISTDDCFYLPYNALSRIDTTSILALDPFLNADANFIASDVVNGALQQVQRDNLTWALPLNLQPAVLRYDAARFEQVGLPAPVNSWTVSDFQNALAILHPNTSDPAPFATLGNDGTPLLLLIAAYGGLPLDYRTTPSTINFTDSMTVGAIQQVLDLARGGYIAYSELATMNSNFASPDSAAITTDTLNDYSFFNPVPRPMVGYPTGSDYNGVSYTLGTAYISASTPYVDACYRWISTLARHAEVFGAMPARSSFIAEQAVTQGTEATSTYQQLDTLLRQPNTIIFPALNPQTALMTVSQWWLYRAFDDYVLRGQDLEAALAQAEAMSLSFQQCVASLPTPVSNDQIAQCATSIDPTLTPLFAQFQ
jgi:ABC-type glycerol-3-phosphate transport system substrate-binding protein